MALNNPTLVNMPYNQQIHIYIYIYREREREREKYRQTNKPTDRDKERQRDRKCACGVMDIVVGNGYGDQSSNPRGGCLHFSYLEKGMNPTILLPVMGKMIEKTGLFSFSIATCLGEGKF